MKDFGHIISSGMVSVYVYPDEEKYGIRTGMNIFLKRLTITGFICSDPRLTAKYMGTFPSVSTCLLFFLPREICRLSGLSLQHRVFSDSEVA